MGRFFVHGDAISNDEIVIVGQDVKHIKNVLRMKQGDLITICDGAGTDYVCTIIELQDDKIMCKISVGGKSLAEPEYDVTVFHGLPKGSKFDEIIQKCVELGATRIVPVKTKRTIVEIKDAKSAAKKIERYNKIALEACKQCNRGVVPVVEEFVDFDSAITMMKESDLCFIPYENEKDCTIKSFLQGQGKDKPKSAAFFIGPEGGFDDAEIAKAKAAGITTVSLGPRILRTETAAPAVLAMLMYEMEEST